MPALPRGSAGQFILSHPCLGSSALLPALEDPITSFSWKLQLSKPAHDTLSFCFLPDNFYWISKFACPSVHQPFLPLDNASHGASPSRPHHPLTRLGSADLSSSHKQEIRCGKQRFLLKIQPVGPQERRYSACSLYFFINKINIFCVHARLYTAHPKWCARTSKILNTANIQSKFHLLHGSSDCGTADCDMKWLLTQIKVFYL